MMQTVIQNLVDFLVTFATDWLMPFMIIAFFLAVIFKILVHYTISREAWFAKEFEKRVHSYLSEHKQDDAFSFYGAAKKTLEKTYYEIFEVRSIMKRRKPDAILALNDRVFLIQHGVALLVRDTLKQIKFLKHNGNHPKLLEISKSVYQNNSCFKKLFGYFPISIFNDMLNILPGIFIVGGIFGTFLGIMKGLPELGSMDLQDIQGSKDVMDKFLLKISFSMISSIIGIILSVSLTVINALMAPEKLFIATIEKFENSLDLLWNASTNNDTDEDSNIEGDKDPLETLAAQALETEIAKGEKGRGSNKEEIDGGT